MSANDRQVAGSHYRAAVQHWDLIAYNNLRYFEAQITRYIGRWKKKNGVQDVEKAFHYLDKLEELLNAGVLSYLPPRPILMLDEYIKENNVSELEAQIFTQIMSYTNAMQLTSVRALMETLIEKAKAHAEGRL